ncbi:MAG: flagellar basal-body rod protein FlgB [Candidatus Raymondbacteria bacterium RifOxyA12_full_50_37]|uniref:Flagellar basal body rod protein FlgB n=1 Tax=Candidatus Raymondbacteria bacterium RIFOXYD12_FULL_49_13 TaxID=1817890 RepID=A0A1F7F4R9_UNCRA|nr:MAG: flagellar basal-body rod protein FlgB [Candidatus Raymondbacteria bacterium RifOxyA12_full_50_37]OGJ91886.1 MAG: flagellar basal-body rod protein FlgB [Candidatus Raymondbacteria bacterium RIFOXYA2_FULL_49_16]OGJ98075.1 MAG: flagellar basal-body rod protein FlgB [Candidatus Raymondbacteria bacterium RIFOXYC2_FULL_50_21]OGK01664.1 MAG: flagellar basal-body rod protein FlgB [Candidatus Raymondbacteria bacterium RIFOXYD12_FULL_49_13]OGK02337.1 MAG: flagellar basal-body rod protein FlgB [Ca
MKPLSIEKLLFDKVARQATYKSLDAGTLRSKAVAQNIANVGTPGYKRQEVSFEKELRQALKLESKGAVTNDKHMEISKLARLKKVHPYSYQPFDSSNSSGENNVDIDMENAKMAENQILFNYGVRFSSFKKLQSAITTRPQF